MKCGLLGRKLGHSYSPQIHALLGDYPYALFEREPEQLEEFLRRGDWDGINVTMPYKKAVIPFLDEVDPIARQLGSVNTIVRRGGRLLGFNTDHFGFSSMVQRSGLAVAGKKVLVLGSGGASVTVQSVLRSLGARVTVISRTGPDHYGNLERHEDAAVIVNTTPVGMYPNTGTSAVALSLFPRLEGVLDVVYNPARTKLLLDAEALGLKTENGLWMLVAQAKKASEYFTGKALSDGLIASVHAAMRQRMENIILIGMPGCGKSTVGRLLAQRLEKEFADADAEIEALAGMSIPDIFEKEGECGFRAYETRVLEALGKRSGLVIATGGGCVTRQENYPLLHQNGSILWLQRRPDALSREGRPLSQAGSLEEMQRIRLPMYRRFADFSVNNDGRLEEALAAILEVLK